MSVDLQRLTVPQLKALCKERGLNGYSKLPKPALIEKLAAPGGGISLVLPASSAAAARPEPPAKNSSKKKQPERSQAAGRVTTQVIAPNNPSTDQQSALGSNAAIEEHTAVKSLVKESPNAPVIPDAPKEISSLTELYQQGTGNLRIVQQQRTAGTSLHAPSPLPPSGGTTDRSLFRPQSISQMTRPEGGGEPPRKKQKSKHNQNQGMNAVQQVTAPQIQASAIVQKPIPVVIQPVNKEKIQATKHMPKETAGRRKRYIPLVIKSRNTSTAGLSQGLQRAESTSFYPTPSGSSSQHSASVAIDPRNGLFEIPVIPIESGLSFKAITLPPSLSQRKFATKLAVILRDIDATDMSSLTLTSRLFRYSAYLSAASHLKRWYTGERLGKVLGMEELSVDRMSLWEYRRLREKEIEERKSILSGSMRVSGSAQVLGRLVGWDVGVIGDSVWGRDDARGLVVALRFLLTRCYFCVSLNHGLEEVRRERIIDVQEVIKSEIWCMTVEKRDESRKLVKFYVLEATCEVIGSPVGLDKTLPSRGDWSGYVKNYVSEHGAEKAIGIMDHIRWTNHEEYGHGISKVWLKRVQGEVGKLKMIVARRYILACTMANSLSGRYMTSSEMEQELSGLENKMSACQRMKETRINLFVPAHHHVESVHFTSSMKRPLHPALAVVQTPSREYFILKENGMQIGCEEEGIADVWMEVIGCFPTGEAKEDNNKFLM